MPVSESKKTLQQYRREHGLCIDGGEEAFGKLRCPFHAAKQAASRKRSQERKKAISVCQNSGCHSAAMPGCTVCSDCSRKASEYSSARYQRNKELGVCRYCGDPSDGKARCPDCAKDFAEYSQEWYQQRLAAGICVGCAGPLEPETTTVLCMDCKIKRRQVDKRRWTKLKLSALQAYGGPTPVCAGECGETDIEILEIDHINGGGNQHRKLIGVGNTYLWLQQQGYPPGYRVLCPTCNKKAHKGIPLPNEQKE